MTTRTRCVLFLALAFGCGSENIEAIGAEQPKVIDSNGIMIPCGPVLMICSADEEAIRIFDWAKLGAPGRSPGLSTRMNVAFLDANTLALCPNDDATVSDEGRNRTLVVKRVHDGNEITRWALGKEWYSSVMRGSRGGKYIAVALSEDLTFSHTGDNPSVRIGIIGPRPTDLQWIQTLTSDYFGHSRVEDLAPSDDGNRIGVAGWRGRDLMIDVPSKTVLWTSEVRGTPVGIALTRDGGLAYATGGFDCTVYEFDGKNGKVLRKWAVEERYGYRMVSVAVSPDGRLVAAGTGPLGEVFVWSTKSGKMVMRLRHDERATVYNLAFSADSTKLATGTGSWGACAGKVIKIWIMPKD